MAIDTTQKRQALEAQAMTALDQLMEALERLALISTEMVTASLTMQDSDFAVDGMRHLDATIMGDMLTQFDYTNNASLVTYLITNGLSVTFDKVRP